MSGGAPCAAAWVRCCCCAPLDAPRVRGRVAQRGAGPARPLLPGGSDALVRLGARSRSSRGAWRQRARPPKDGHPLKSAAREVGPPGGSSVTWSCWGAQTSRTAAGGGCLGGLAECLAEGVKSVNSAP